jgi:serine protease Do
LSRYRRLFCLVIFLFIITILPAQSPARERPIDDVVATASRSIVNIRTEEWTKNSPETKRSAILRKLFDYEDEEEQFSENIGSGVVLDPTGIVVTNEHLIAKAVNIRVKFLSGKEYDAYVLGSDPELDIALLKINGDETFPFLKTTPRQSVKVGETAIVIGNPYGLSSTVTVGVISALGRNLRIENRTYMNLIQTDAAINPGSSGGALLDKDGVPLGVVTAIYGEGKGIGFAIPMEDVMNMLDEFLEGTVQRPLIGLFIDKKKGTGGSYLYVNQVIPGSPAETNGFRVGDHIVEINKKKIKDGMKLHSLLRSVETSEQINLKFQRGTKYQEVGFQIPDLEKYIPVPLDEKLCGVRIRGIKGYPKLKFKLKDNEGVVATKVFKNGIAAKGGLQAGDVIIKINNNRIKGEKDFNAYMMEGLKRNYVLYQVKRKSNIFFLPIKLDTLL